MKPSEDVIVTVTLGREQFDMELPSFLPICDVKEKMCEMLRAIRPNRRFDAEDTVLFSDGRKLPDDKCLASCGVWDGSIIACVNESEDKTHEQDSSKL